MRNYQNTNNQWVPPNCTTDMLIDVKECFHSEKLGVLYIYLQINSYILFSIYHQKPSTTEQRAHY